MNERTRWHWVTVVGTDKIIQEISKWAIAYPLINRVWIHGSRVVGNNRPDSDIDIAVECDPLVKQPNTNYQDPFDQFFSNLKHREEWETELNHLLEFKVHLDLYDPNGSTATIGSSINRASVLVYEKM